MQYYSTRNTGVEHLKYEKDRVNRIGILEERGSGTHLTIELHYYLKPFPMNLIGGLFRWNARKQLNSMYARIKQIAEVG